MFAKWRVVLKIGPNEPFQLAFNENANDLCQYVIICQENGLFTIIEFWIRRDESHDINKCVAITDTHVPRGSIMFSETAVRQSVGINFDPGGSLSTC